jgi:iron complex transport system ATP-binding protein
MNTAPLTRQQPSPPFLEFENVTVFTEGKRILDAISMTIQTGENVAILGPNGSGKSSLIKTITREYHPAFQKDGYTCRIWGKDRWNVFDLRSRLGIVSSDLQQAFAQEMSGREVILSGFFSSVGLFNHIVTPAMEERTEEIAAFLDVSHLLDRSMTGISTGEARRLLIGRALVHDPEVLILDEPTNSLDLHALHTFRGTLRKVARSGTGIVLVTHMLSDIIPEISRVIMIRNGRVYGAGPKATVLTDQQIGELFSVPVKIREEGGYYYVTGY